VRGVRYKNNSGTDFTSRTVARMTAVLSIAKVILGTQPEPADLANARNFEEGLIALSGLMGVNVSEVGVSSRLRL
jgi:hypothetical protein